MTQTSARSTTSSSSKHVDGRADHTSTAPRRVTQSNCLVGAVDQTSARSSSKPPSKERDGRADHTSTGVPIPQAQSKTCLGTLVDQTSARSKAAPVSNPPHGRADHTSTTPILQTKSKSFGGVVDHTSARSTDTPTSKTSPGRADQTSTAPIQETKRKPSTGVVDQLPASPKVAPEDKWSAGDAGPFLADPVLGILAAAADDLEMVRIASENRLRALTREHRLTLDNDDVVRMAAMVAQLNTKSELLKKLGIDTKGMERGLEQEAILNMNRAVRRHPLWAWAKSIAGVGEKQFARLLAVIGDPYWNEGYVNDDHKRNRPRTMRELRAYCGWHVIDQDHVGKTPDDSKRTSVGVAPKRQRGCQSNWNDEARKRVWLIAESCMKQRNSIYREVYDAARKQYEDTVHPSECVRCGPKGKPAQPGSPRSAGHQHAMALRKVAVAFLADLWREAKRLHTDNLSPKVAPKTQGSMRRQATTSRGEQ